MANRQYGITHSLIQALLLVTGQPAQALRLCVLFVAAPSHSLFLQPQRDNLAPAAQI
jgi:hypothetical protein